MDPNVKAFFASESLGSFEICSNDSDQNLNIDSKAPTNFAALIKDLKNAQEAVNSKLTDLITSPTTFTKNHSANSKHDMTLSQDSPTTTDDVILKKFKQ
ncbi:hypothetical protein AYI70_g8626 [Smittium culicis]|uniref:Uncharacterized protein n=1 Tax=Smittium culicis TaxID=133412 RepID=A0A1R1XF26_9FUNG|nr:hypothetical protein AYI70_g8626 [Smittium culicis]